MKLNLYPFSTRRELMIYEAKHPDFIFPMSYYMMGKNILINDYQLLTLLINNALNKHFINSDFLWLDNLEPNNDLSEPSIFLSLSSKKTCITIDFNYFDDEISIIDSKNITYYKREFTKYYDYVYQININSFNCSNNGEPISYFEINDEKKQHYEIVDINLPNFEKMSLFNHEYDKEFILFMKIFSLNSRKEIEDYIKKFPLFKKAYVLQKDFHNEEFVIKSFLYELYYRRENKKYLERGKIEATLQLTRKMLEEKVDMHIISKVTGLSLKEIKEINEL